MINTLLPRHDVPQCVSVRIYLALIIIEIESTYNEKAREMN
jgi:hypothetical protein